MKLEVGMYVRAKNGKIAKISNIVDNVVTEDDYGREMNTNKKAIRYNDNDGWNKMIFLEDINGEPSFNKIDLVEVGDVIVVDNCKYEVVCDEKHFDNRLYICRPTVDEETRRTTIEYLVEYNKIQSIVTKEQFKSCEYHFEEE